MRVIPVMDLQGGQVVRGVAGQRDQYREVKSDLADPPRPAAIARALVDVFRFDEVYVADLDAIAVGQVVGWRGHGPPSHAAAPVG